MHFVNSLVLHTRPNLLTIKTKMSYEKTITYNELWSSSFNSLYLFSRISRL